MSNEWDQYEQWRELVLPALQSKLEEFYLLGVNRLTLDELWSFIMEMIRKKKVKDLKLHQFVNFILTVSINDYMNKIRLEMFQRTEIFSVDE